MKKLKSFLRRSIWGILYLLFLGWGHAENLQAGESVLLYECSVPSICSINTSENYRPVSYQEQTRTASNDFSDNRFAESSLYAANSIPDNSKPTDFSPDESNADTAISLPNESTKAAKSEKVIVAPKSVNENNNDSWFQHLVSDLQIEWRKNKAQLENGSFIDMVSALFSFFIASLERISLGYRLLFYLSLFALFFLFNITSVVVATVISNWVFNRKEKYYENKRKEIIEIVSPYFYDDLDDDEEAVVVEKLSRYRSRRDKQIIIDVLIEGKRNFIGESSSKIKELYQVLKLYKVSLRKIRFGSWYRRSLGLRELAFLGRTLFKKEINKYINDKHQHVRTEAILSYMLLDNKNPFGFLMELKYSFVRWDSLSIYYTMYFNGIEPPLMAQMLNHPDAQVRLFLLRMISIYNQLEAAREVTRCLLDENPEIRQEALITLRALEYYRIKVWMKRRYNDECHSVKLEILRSMKHFIEDQDISFLEERVRKGSFSEVFEAVKLLYRFSNYGEKKLWSLNEELKGKIEIFIKHVSEPRNKHVA